MAKIALVRVDSRLIHGQVATGFVGKVGADEIVIIDNATASNEFARDVLSLAVPPGAHHDVYTVAQAAEAWKENEFGNGVAMVIIKSIPFAYDVYRAGFMFRSLMIGGVGQGEGRHRVDGAISLNQAEAELLDKLSEAGVEVTLQQTAQSTIVPWKVARHKLKF